jgi:hypothetical protein
MITAATVHCRQQIIDHHAFYLACRGDAAATRELARIAGKFSH